MLRPQACAILSARTLLVGRVSGNQLVGPVWTKSWPFGRHATPGTAPHIAARPGCPVQRRSPSAPKGCQPPVCTRDNTMSRSHVGGGGHSTTRKLYKHCRPKACCSESDASIGAVETCLFLLEIAPTSCFRSQLLHHKVGERGAAGATNSTTFTLAPVFAHPEVYVPLRS